MSILLRRVTAAIANEPIPGVRVVDIDNIPEIWDGRQTLLYPKPDGFITNPGITRDSYGMASLAKMTLSYTMTYVLVSAKPGEGRGLFDKYPDFLDAFCSVVERFVEHIDYEDGSVSIEFFGINNFGAVYDPAGNICFGAELYFRVTEFIH